MSLDTYANLKLEVAEWAGRADLDVTSGGVDTFIDVTEAWLNRNLRVEQMLVQNDALTVSATGVVTHPSDWLAWKRLTILDTPMIDLPAHSEASAYLLDNSNSSGTPVCHIVRGSSTQVWPVPDATYVYRGIYYGKIPALSGSQTTNWLLTAYPDAYLFGCLSLGAARLADDGRAAGWRSAFAEVIAEIESASNNDGFLSVGIPVNRNVI